MLLLNETHMELATFVIVDSESLTHADFRKEKFINSWEWTLIFSLPSCVWWYAWLSLSDQVSFITVFSLPVRMSLSGAAWTPFFPTNSYIQLLPKPVLMRNNSTWWTTTHFVTERPSVLDDRDSKSNNLSPLAFRWSKQSGIRVGR